MKDLMKMNVSELDSETLRETSGGVSWGLFGVTARIILLIKDVNNFLGNDGPGSAVE